MTSHNLVTPSVTAKTFLVTESHRLLVTHSKIVTGSLRDQ
jgi:hypothetical protein